MPFVVDGSAFVARFGPAAPTPYASGIARTLALAWYLGVGNPQPGSSEFSAAGCPIPVSDESQTSWSTR